MVDEIMRRHNRNIMFWRLVILVPVGLGSALLASAVPAFSVLSIANNAAKFSGLGGY